MVKMRAFQVRGGGFNSPGDQPWCHSTLIFGEFTVISKLNLLVSYQVACDLRKNNCHTKQSIRLGQTNPPPFGNQKASRERNVKTQRSGNVEVTRTFGDMVHLADME